MTVEAVASGTSQPEQNVAAHICRHHPAQAERPACACQRLFWPRRIHALTGALLICFLLVHFSVCITGLHPSSYQHSVDSIGAMLVHLPGLVLLTIFLPLIAQASTGLFLLKKEGMRYNVKKCNRGGKLRFFSQRISALVILGFVVMHVGVLHQWGFHLLYRLTHAPFLSRYAGSGLFQSHQTAFASTALAFREALGSGSSATAGNWCMMFLLLLGVWATAFHAANGAWTGGIIWKLTDRSTTSRWSGFCLLLGILLMLTGTVAWYAFTFSAHARAVLSLAHL
jgi:succinate dehydrogenase / fumarate reductase cytochrome b subunit